MSELKPCKCPLCKREVEVRSCVPNTIMHRREHKNVYFVIHRCSFLRGHDVLTKDFDSEEEAIAAWNSCTKPDNGRGKAGRPIDANTLSDEISRLKISIGGESLFTPAIRETILRTIDERATVAIPRHDNAPLTLEGLRGMDGEPVYLVYPNAPELDGWQILKGVDDEPDDDDGSMGVLFSDDVWEHAEDCGDSWLAYRRKPEPDGGAR